MGDFEDTYACLIAVEKYDDNVNLPDLPQASSNVVELRKILKSETIGLPVENIVSLFNPKTPQDILSEIDKFLSHENIKTLIIYYAGHGIISDITNGHYLTVSSSSLDKIHINGLDISTLNNVFETNKNLKVLLILDSCHSEMAFQKFECRNFLLIASSAMNKEAKYPENDDLSAFTNELIKIFKIGIPNNNSTITWREVYTQLKINLESSNMPIPKISIRNDVEELIAAKNNYLEPIISLDEKWISLINYIASFNKDLKNEIDNIKSRGGASVTASLIDKLGQYMPFLIGYYLEAICRKEVKKEHYFSLYEKSVQFLYFIFFMQLESLKSKEEIASYLDYNDIKSDFKQPPIQNITFNHLKRLCNDIIDSNLSLFISEFDWKNPVLENIATQIENLKQSSNPDLKDLKEYTMEFLKNIGCLVNYELVSIREIRLRYPKYKEMRFDHSISVLNGAKPTSYEDWDCVSEYLKNIFTKQTEVAHSHSVLLINKKAQKPVDYINLWPLVIDANAYYMDRRSPDIYCYIGKNKENNCMVYEPVIKSKGIKTKTICELDEQADTKPFDELLK